MVDKAKPENRLRFTEVFKTLARLQTPEWREIQPFERMWDGVQHYLNTARLSESRQKGIRVVPPAAEPLINILWYAHGAKSLEHVWE